MSTVLLYSVWTSSVCSAPACVSLFQCVPLSVGVIIGGPSAAVSSVVLKKQAVVDLLFRLYLLSTYFLSWCCL